MTPVLAIAILSASVQLTESFGFPGFSWSWGMDNITRVITTPEIAERYPLYSPYKQCSSGLEGIMTRLFVQPCVLENDRCKLTRGENVTLDLDFISNIPVDSLVGTLSAIFHMWLVPLPLGDPEDLCKSDQILCPILPFYPYRYRTSIFIRPSLPAIRTDIQVIIKTNSGRSIACAIVPVVVIGGERDLRDGLADDHLRLAVGDSQ